MWNILISLIIIFATVRTEIPIQNSSGFETEPERASLIIQDVINFTQALKIMEYEKDSVTVLQREYFDKATPGLKVYIEKLNLSPEKFINEIRRRPLECSALYELPEKLIAQEKSIRKALKKLKQLIPDAVFLPTYFLIGPWRNHSEASENGLLISVEGYDHTAIDNICLVIHEHAHIQQAMAQGLERYQAIYGPEKSLLALIIREGTAEFIAKMVTGKIIQEKNVKYTVDHEKQLWDQIKNELQSKESGGWMGKQPKNQEQPRNVGYVIGYLIVEEFYNKATDKVQAMHDILSVTNYPAFLIKSGYENKLVME